VNMMTRCDFPLCDMLTSFHEPETLPTRRLSSPSSRRTYPPPESNDDPRQAPRASDIGGAPSEDGRRHGLASGEWNLVDARRTL